jgi:hypothetical protein
MGTRPIELKTKFDHVLGNSIVMTHVVLALRDRIVTPAHHTSHTGTIQTPMHHVNLEQPKVRVPSQHTGHTRLWLWHVPHHDKPHCDT